MSLIDPNNLAVMNLESFRETIGKLKQQGFALDEAEIADLFKYMTKADRTTGLKINTKDLATRVYQGVKAILIDRVSENLDRASMSLHRLFSTYDKNKDGFLEYEEFNKALTDCQVDLGRNMRDILLKEVLDPQGAKKSATGGKISFGILKFYMESFGPDGVDSVVRSQDQIDSSSRAGRSAVDTTSSAT